MKKKLSNSPHAPTASQETASESWLDFAFGLNDVTCDYRSLGFDEAQLI